MSNIEEIDIHQVRRELWGKSHYFDYFDALTMRFFNSRLLRAVKLPSGDLLCLESYRHGYDGAKREYRVVLLQEGSASRSDDLPCYSGVSKLQAQRQFQRLLMGGLTC